MILFSTIKVRLTLWYLLAIVLLMMLFGIVGYVLLSNNLYATFDRSLETRLTEIQGSMSVDGQQVLISSKVDELLMVYGADGKLLQRLGPEVQSEKIGPLVQQALFGESSFITAKTSDGQKVRLYAVPFTVNSSTRIALIIGKLPLEVESVLATFRTVFTYSFIFVVLAASVGGILLANRALRPVDRITATAQEIGEGDLSRRIDVASDDELGRLAATLNGMIARLEESFKKQQQFTADASHELRTPLAILQAESSLALEKERTPAEYRRSLALVSQGVDYMSSLIGKLLWLARNDGGSETLNLEDIDLKGLLTDLAADAEVLARDKGLHFALEELAPITVRGDRIKLKQLFLNLLENAVRYTPAGGTISLTLARRDGQAVATVRDTGIGISAEHLPRIFERFYRVDKARSRAEGGSGLGLAIVMCIARAHHGDIEVESEVGQGSAFSLVLPLSEDRATN